MSYPVGVNESKRLEMLHSLRILDTGEDKAIEEICGVVKTIFQVPLVTISLIDSERQWFKSHQGIDVCETSREVAFCNHTILNDEVFEVTDATKHPTFKNNPLVTGPPLVRYYCGAPIIVHDMRIGALCLIAWAPRSALDPEYKKALQGFANIVAREILVRKLLKDAAGAMVMSI